MLFNSYVFLFAFLPLMLAAVVLARRSGRLATVVVLIAASLVFYGWFVPSYVAMLLASALFNYMISLILRRRPGSGLLALGVAANLLLLGVFKYLDFLIGTINGALSADWPLTHILLPLAISFFTFQQIAYLVDVRRGLAEPPGLPDYLLFVCFFPQLIAGPIVHHREMIPQFHRSTFGVITSATLVTGMSWFAIGLAKKTLFADQLAPIADRIFGLSAAGAELSLFEAWFGTLAFAFQIYFDFSGYSDMAIGLAILFGVMLPINFNAPYKATSIIEFWRRWHMTLSRFLRDYLYIALGGNRSGRARRHANLMITMVLGGLWHGAAWTFVIWGGLHGLYLMLNHAWWRFGLPLPRAVGWLLTMIAVCFAWTFFRAEGFGTALRIVEGMAGLNGVTLAADHQALLGPVGNFLAGLGVRFEGLPVLSLTDFPIFAALIAFVVLAPTAQHLMAWRSDTMSVQRAVGVWQASAAGVVLALGITGIGQASQFIYFQF